MNEWTALVARKEEIDSSLCNAEEEVLPFKRKTYRFPSVSTQTELSPLRSAFGISVVSIKLYDGQ